ncbi:MAG: RNA 2',3'-cyclic phosphodiesterase [Nanoarchaeota archaeon]|jgi:2'-5' RNA ligase|nr:RNA 2',3'-cyclic phosphodiesterase [Nanoarchaeota archaeon]
MTKRCFISINLPQEVREQIYTAISGKFNKVLKGKELPMESYHMTLKFLGEIDEEKVEKIKAKMETIDFEGFEVKIGRLGYMENNVRGILYVELISDWLMQLVKEVWGKVGWSDRKFKSHITLMRTKKCLNIHKLRNMMKDVKFRSLFFDVDKIYLMESELLKEGAKYSVLKEVSLK